MKKIISMLIDLIIFITQRSIFLGILGIHPIILMGGMTRFIMIGTIHIIAGILLIIIHHIIHGIIIMVHIITTTIAITHTKIITIPIMAVEPVPLIFLILINQGELQQHHKINQHIAKAEEVIRHRIIILV